MVSVAAAAAENPCAVAVTEDQRVVLNRARTESDHFHVRVMTGEVNGKTRTVVFLGEAHNKGEADKALGKAVVAAFDLPVFGNRSGIGALLTTHHGRTICSGVSVGSNELAEIPSRRTAAPRSFNALASSSLAMRSIVAASLSGGSTARCRVIV